MIRAPANEVQRRRGRKLLDRVKLLGKNLQAYLAGEGAALPPIGDVDDAADPLTLQEMLANRLKFCKACFKPRDGPETCGRAITQRTPFWGWVSMSACIA